MAVAVEGVTAVSVATLMRKSQLPSPSEAEDTAERLAYRVDR